MAKTHHVLTRPAPGTVIAPVHTYDDEQKVKMQALREVSGHMARQERRRELIDQLSAVRTDTGAA